MNRGGGPAKIALGLLKLTVPVPGKNMSESVAAALEGRVRLLVIDNCEHVLDAAADLVEAIVARSATVLRVSTLTRHTTASIPRTRPIHHTGVEAFVALQRRKASTDTSSGRTIPTEQLFEFAAGVDELALAVGQPGFGPTARLMRLGKFVQ